MMYKGKKSRNIYVNARRRCQLKLVESRHDSFYVDQQTSTLHTNYPDIFRDYISTGGACIATPFARAVSVG